MIIYGYAKGYQYRNDGVLLVRVRIPSMHGPYKQADANGQTIRNYTRDADLPYYPSLLLPHLPIEGEVVALSSMDTKNTNFMVIGITGGSYASGFTINQ